MVGLGAGLRPGRRRVGGSSGLGNDLDFSALSALPVGRQSAVTTAANAAATTLGVSAQSVVDALGQTFRWYDWRNAYTNTAATVAASQGDPVAALRCYKSNVIADQANASNRPVLGASSLAMDGTKFLRSAITGFPADNYIFIVSVQDTVVESTTVGYAGWGVSPTGGARATLLKTNTNIASKGAIVFKSAGQGTWLMSSQLQVPNTTLNVNGTANSKTDAVQTPLDTDFVIGGFANPISFFTGDFYQTIVSTQVSDLAMLREFIKEYDSLVLSEVV